MYNIVSGMILFILVTCTLILLMVLSLQNTTYEYMATPNNSGCPLNEDNVSSFAKEIKKFKSKIEDIFEKLKKYNEEKAKSVGCDDDYKSSDGDDACGNENFQNPPQPPTPCETYHTLNKNFNHFFNSTIRKDINELVENINSAIETKETGKKKEKEHIHMAQNARTLN